MSDEEDTTVLLCEKKIEKLENCPNSEHITSKGIKLKEQNVTSTSIQSHVVFASTVTLISGLSFGYDMGICTNLMNRKNDDFEVNCVRNDILGSTWLIGALFAATLGGTAIDYCGRKWTMCVSSLLLAFGSTLSAVSYSYHVLLWARLVCGFSGALSAVVQCIYAAEISGQQVRGRNVLMHQVGVASGLLLANLVDATNMTEWRLAFWFTVAVSLVQSLMTILFLPRSPHFTLLHAVQNTRNSNQHFMWCKFGNMMEAFGLTFGLVLLQQFSGNVNVLYYAPRLYVLLGVCPDIAVFVGNISYGIIQVLSVVLCLWLIDRVGRRPALIIGATCMMTSIALLGVFSVLEEGETGFPLPQETCGSLRVGGSLIPHSFDSKIFYSINQNEIPSKISTETPPPYPFLPTPIALTDQEPLSESMQGCEEAVVSTLSVGLRILAVCTLLIYEIAYSFSFFPVTWLLFVELFPAATRGRSVAITTTLFWLSDFIIPVTFNNLLDALTLGGSFLLYSFVCFLAVMFVFLFVPETKGKSLHQVAQELKNVSPRTRMFQNLQGIPCLSKNQWLHQKAQQYRQVSRSGVESTVI